MTTRQESRFLILTGDGINCANETAWAFELAGGQAEIVHINDLLETPERLLDFDGMLVTFVEATPTETSINGNTISWDYSNLNPFETRSIEVVFDVAEPPVVEQGDVLPYIATINPVSGDAAPDCRGRDAAMASRAGPIGSRWLGRRLATAHSSLCRARRLERWQ